VALGSGKGTREAPRLVGEDPRSTFGTLGGLGLGESATMWKGAPKGDVRVQVVES
jgi:hypothetical protein